MIKTIQIGSPMNKFEHILNEREILNAIQLCPQIIKQDKLFIRTIIKDFYKQYDPQAQIQPQIIQLLQIFNDCRKPLSKIHLYENHSHWLQVKLRRYITIQKKKQKQQNLQQFRKQKCQQKIKKTHMMQKRIRNEESLQKQQNYRNNNGSINGSRSQFRKYTNSYQKSRIQSPKNFCQTSRFNQTSRHKFFAQSLSPNYTMGRTGAWPQTCKNSYNKSLKQKLGYDFDKRTKNNRSITAKNNIKSENEKKLIQKSTYENYKKNISSQKNIKKGQKQNEQNKILQGLRKKANQYPFFVSNNKNAGNTQLNKQEKYNKQNKNIKKDKEANLQSQIYQYKSKASSLMKYEQLSSIKEVKQSHNQSIKHHNQIISGFNQPFHNQHLYTSPELLEQCRKFIKKSEYFYNNDNYNFAITSKIDQYQIIQRNIIESNQKEPSNQKEMFKNQTNEEFNIFDQIQCVQYHSPQFIQQPIEKFKSLKELLNHIFYKDWKVYISELDQQEIIARAPINCQQTTKLLIQQIDPKTKFLSFLDFFAHFRKNIGITFSFSNIFLLLDVDSKGVITKTDYQSFLQNFLDCPIQAQTLQNLKDKLGRFQAIVEERFKGCQIVPGCFEYLQIIQNPEIFQLGQILQMFEFEIDGDSNTFNNDINE